MKTSERDVRSRPILKCAPSEEGVDNLYILFGCKNVSIQLFSKTLGLLNLKMNQSMIRSGLPECHRAKPKQECVVAARIRGKFSAAENFTAHSGKHSQVSVDATASTRKEHSSESRIGILFVLWRKIVFKLRISNEKQCFFLLVKI